MYSGKIFCIGFQKTGTSSLGRALTQLGYRVCGAVGLKDPDLANNIHDIAMSAVPEYDAFQDNPWPIFFRELDEKCPGSKFILTTRDEDSWIRSVVRHFGTDPHPMQQWVYGVAYPIGNEQIFLERYRRHNREVLEYFSERMDDLLILPIEEPDLWGKLGEFLDAKVPSGAFPHSNKGGSGWKLYRRARNKAKRIARRLAGKQI